MVIRTAAHNRKISEGMKRFYQKVQVGVGQEKYSKMVGPAARYRSLKKAGIMTPKQIEMARRKITADKKKKTKAKLKKTKTVK